MGGKSGPGVCRWHRNGDQGMLCKGEKQEPRPGKREWGRGRNQRIFCLIQQGAVFIRTMKTKGKTKLRKDKRIHSSNLHSGVMVLHAFHLWKLKQCVGPKNEAQVGRSDRENKMQLTGAVLALPSKIHPRGSARWGRWICCWFTIPCIFYEWLRDYLRAILAIHNLCHICWF